MGAKKINILLVGYGKMGKIIYDNADFINGKVVTIYDPAYPDYRKPIEEIDVSNIDVAIEFTHPRHGFYNVQKLLYKKIPVVTGTTGWFKRISEIAKQFNPENYTLVYGANFSVGMNLLYRIVEESAKLVNSIDLYDVFGLESHHREKVDSPSGTAKVLAEIIQKNIPAKNKAVFELNNRPLEEGEFSFTSIRAGNIIGYHEIGFDSDFDEIKLMHNAKNRKGFAIGALLAAKYAVQNKGYHDFKDIFKQVISD